MDFRKLIGKNFDLISIENESVDIERNNFELELNEGLPEKWFVTAKNGSFQMILDSDKLITCIFLFPTDNGKFAIDDYSTDFGKKEVRGKMGNPDKTGEPFEHAIIESNGGFDRFDREISYHFEYQDSSQTMLKQITLMSINTESKK